MYFLGRVYSTSFTFSATTLHVKIRRKQGVSSSFLRFSLEKHEIFVIECKEI